MHPLDRPYGLLHAAVALQEQLGGFIEQAGGGGGAVGDLVDRLGHLGDGGGDLIGLGLLLLQVAGDGLGIAQIAFGRAQDPAAGLLGARQHGVELGLIHQHGELDGGDVVDLVGVEQLHQRVVETAAGHLVELAEATGQGMGDHGCQQQRYGRQGQLPERSLLIPQRNHGRQAQQQAEPDRQGVGEGRQPERQRGLVSAQPGIDALGPLLDLLTGGGTHRLILHHLAVGILERRDEGADPVVIAILAAILHRPHPAFAGPNMVPEIGEGLLGHIRVAHQVVVLPLQLLQIEAGDMAKLVVGIGDPALQIRGGDQALVLRIEAFALGNGLIDSHGGSGTGLLERCMVNASHEPARRD